MEGQSRPIEIGRTEVGVLDGRRATRWGINSRTRRFEPRDGRWRRASRRPGQHAALRLARWARVHTVVCHRRQRPRRARCPPRRVALRSGGALRDGVIAFRHTRQRRVDVVAPFDAERSERRSTPMPNAAARRTRGGQGLEHSSFPAVVFRRFPECLGGSNGLQPADFVACLASTRRGVGYRSCCPDDGRPSTRSS